MLTQSEPRCEGREAMAFGERVLAHECIACLRRTERPHDIQRVQWIKPAASGYCIYSMYASEDDEGAEYV